MLQYKCLRCLEIVTINCSVYEKNEGTPPAPLAWLLPVCGEQQAAFPLLQLEVFLWFGQVSLCPARPDLTEAQDWTLDAIR
ncbi:hypothetical protein DPEC_G00065770 [Dallia pectoralis]|uniref:Uncharacterized protein n=1 Tax=Dallia pectoralis TaxID=75939 RepID=A0ACC2H8J1_DALPE|nr:hypothetical protein DPEC_G00065770 [Dallia pectoralis]